jgi:hypothetical protein
MKNGEKLVKTLITLSTDIVGILAINASEKIKEVLLPEPKRDEED